VCPSLKLFSEFGKISGVGSITQRKSAGGKKRGGFRGASAKVHGKNGWVRGGSSCGESKDTLPTIEKK